MVCDYLAYSNQLNQLTGVCLGRHLVQSVGRQRAAVPLAMFRLGHRPQRTSFRPNRDYDLRFIVISYPIKMILCMHLQEKRRYLVQFLNQFVSEFADTESDLVELR